MYHVLLDSTGNLIESYDDEKAARAELERVVREDPDSAEHVAMLTYDDAGMPVGDAVQASSVATMSFPV